MLQCMAAELPTDSVMPTAEQTARRNRLRPGADAPRTAGWALAVFWGRLSPWILVATLGVMGVLRWREGPLSWVDLAIALAAWATFPITEWMIHIYMLHYRPRRIFGRVVDFHLPRTHRWHHADPWNLQWVFVPLHIYPLVLPTLAGLYLLAGPWRGGYLTLCLMYLLLGLHYEWTHYLTHINWCPPWGYYQRRVLAHRLHHFRNENHWWGVSMGLGDRLFGTAPDARATMPSGTTKDIARPDLVGKD